MAGGGVVRFGVKMIKMVLPVVKEVQSLGCESSQGNQIFLSKVFRKLVEKIWERVGGEDVRERIEQLGEEYEKWRKEREEECEKWWKDAEEEEAAEEKEEKAEKEEEEAERDDIEEEEEEEETKWSKMDEVMEHICEAGDPFVWGN
ncbi:PREDICTED: X-linked retinitis pigmentosa GTPase regulator-interacting protein 1-like [Brassica oleracea var. oleracea]|uniref:X-linked retinitis pigmentosa GTPase regulator-interacting protein 1-like n=1 Tax=Brassica oleracea var. oleracea TaxID=109376 RepID=UPI0006A6BE9F|nr:PREDICTED: X-linked retinitis pigmentosa GTPase regulator-interacting protein 1-like [Brassica oleracea var. oleracea]